MLASWRLLWQNDPVMWSSARSESAGKVFLSHGCPGPSESCFEIANPLYGVGTVHGSVLLHSYLKIKLRSGLTVEDSTTFKCAISAEPYASLPRGENSQTIQSITLDLTSQNSALLPVLWGKCTSNWAELQAIGLENSTVKECPLVLC